MIDINESKLAINGGSINNCRTTGEGTIHSNLSNVVLNSNNSIHNCYATKGGAIYSLGDSKITLDKENAITNCSATNGGAILLCHSKVFLNHTNVMHSCKAERGGAIYLCASKISYASGFFSPDQYYINCQFDIGKIIYRCNCHNNCSQHNKPWCDNITPVSLEMHMPVSNKDFEKFTGTGIPGCVVSIYNGNTELVNGKVK